MIPNEEKEDWHCLSVRKLSKLFRGITSRHHGDFYCLSCFHSFRTENKLKLGFYTYKQNKNCRFL